MAGSALLIGLLADVLLLAFGGILLAIGVPGLLRAAPVTAAAMIAVKMRNVEDVGGGPSADRAMLAR